MVLLSDFLRFRVADRQHRTAHLVDVTVNLAAGDYPCVDRLVLRVGRPHKTVSLPWSDLASIDWRRRDILLADLEAASDEPLAHTVLAGRDIMDALIVDVERRQTLRANDLWFREQDGDLWLAGADASPWAVLRRLGHGVLGRGAERKLVDWKDLEFLRGDPDAARHGQDYHRQITRLQPAEIARLLDALPYLHAAELLTLMEDPIAADTLETMSPERQTQVIQVLDEDQAVRLLTAMAPEAAADLLGNLRAERAERLLRQVLPTRRELIIDLLRYPDDTAGGIMTNELVCVLATDTVGEARRELKPSISSPDFANYLYVIDSEADRHLEGVVSLRDFAVADDDALIGSLMHADVSSIAALEPARQAARQVADLQLAALPVVSRDKRLLGAITIDMALAHIAPASWRDQAPRVFS